MAQEAIQRQALSSIAPTNPLQMGGASQFALDWGVSQRRLRPPTPPSTGSSERSGMSSISSLTDSFNSDMDIFGGFDDTPKSGGSGIHMKGGVLPVFRNMSMGRPADYYEQRNKVFAPWTKDYPNPVELANMDRIERLRFLVESDLARSKIKRPNFGKIKLG
jgi:hypothetical protein